MSVKKRDQFGNAVRICDLECGREGTLPLFDGEAHVCLPCATRVSERAVVRRELKGLGIARTRALVMANRTTGGRMRWCDRDQQWE